MKDVRILSIDGGGVRGVIPATILAHIEARTGEPIGRSFDLVAGTSTGGILAAGVAIGRPAERLLADYRADAPHIFSQCAWIPEPVRATLTQSGAWRELDRRLRNIRTSYSQENLDRALAARLGDRALSEIDRPLTMIAAYDLQRRKPHFFKSWRARGCAEIGAPSSPSQDFFLRDAARASSSGPGYFPPATIYDRSPEQTARHMIDGGVFANNPVESAYTAARRLFGLRDGDRVTVLSLGCGRERRPVWGFWLTRILGGYAFWAPHAIEIAIEGSATAADYHAKTLLEEDEYLRLQIELNEARAPGARYPEDDIDAVAPANIAALERAARALIERENVAIDAMIARLRARHAPPRIEAGSAFRDGNWRA